MTLGLAAILRENERSRALLEKQVARIPKMEEGQRVAAGSSKQIVPRAEPSTYRGYKYIIRENGVDLALQRGGAIVGRSNR